MFLSMVAVGRLGDDPELRYTQSGQPVCDFPLAVNRNWKDREGNTQQETTWLRVTVWGRQAEHCEEHLTKGSLVLIDGDRMKAEPYIRKDSRPGVSVEVTAQTVRFLQTKQEAGKVVIDLDEIPF